MWTAIAAELLSRWLISCNVVVWCEQTGWTNNRQARQYQYSTHVGCTTSWQLIICYSLQLAWVYCIMYSPCVHACVQIDPRSRRILLQCARNCWWPNVTHHYYCMMACNVITVNNLTISSASLRWLSSCIYKKYRTLVTLISTLIYNSFSTCRDNRKFFFSHME